MTAQSARPVVVLIGPPGVGKTTVGKLLAERLELLHQDSDDAIVAASGMSIPEIFERYGEPEFRRLEAETVAGLLTSFNGVLSLGGGAVMTPATQQALADYVASGGYVVGLDMNGDTAADRLHDGGRPLLSEGDALANWQKLNKTRHSVYRQVSTNTISVDQLSPFQVVDHIVILREVAESRKLGINEA